MSTIKRAHSRQWNELRPVKITPSVSEYAEGSALVEFGKTKVICTASYDSKPPSWLQGSGRGWVTAEYGMIPRSTETRMKRDKAATGGRTQEISRLIGRSLRSCVDLKLMPEKQLIIDCDVLNADGGTRTASITGGFVALVLALKKLKDLGEIKNFPILHYVSAISVGLKKDQVFLDLDYEEDSQISTDMNFVMTSEKKFIEIQGTAEDQAFSKQEFLQMMDLAEQGCVQLFEEQQKILSGILPMKQV
ncbi:MAG: ribonuclease PH [Pseudobdellovibrionaceae bacterium]